jgi:hypothetical protein
MKQLRKAFIKFTGVALIVGATAPASAVTIWTNWATATAGAPGSAAGTLGGVGVSYAGELDAFIINGTSAGPRTAPSSAVRWIPRRAPSAMTFA